MVFQLASSQKEYKWNYVPISNKTSTGLSDKCHNSTDIAMQGATFNWQAMTGAAI